MRNCGKRYPSSLFITLVERQKLFNAKVELHTEEKLHLELEAKLKTELQAGREAKELAVSCHKSYNSGIPIRGLVGTHSPLQLNPMTQGEKKKCTITVRL